MNGHEQDHENTDAGYLASQPVREKLEALGRFIRETMREGVDYGTLPRTSRKCLFKSGAEKIACALNLAGTFEILFEQKSFSEGLFHYDVKAVLVERDTGVIAAEGLGSCNSMESRYAKTDKFSIANTVLKMAKKRAFVDAVLLASASSDVFTQDLEDGIPGEKNPAASDHRQDQNLQKPNAMTGNIYSYPGVMTDGSQPYVGNMSGGNLPQDSNPSGGQQIPPNQMSLPYQPPQSSPQRQSPEEPVSERQVSYIFNLLSSQRIPVEQMRMILSAKYSKTDVQSLSKTEASDYIAYLKSRAAG